MPLLIKLLSNTLVQQLTEQTIASPDAALQLPEVSA